MNMSAMSRSSVPVAAPSSTLDSASQQNFNNITTFNIPATTPFLATTLPVAPYSPFTRFSTIPIIAPSPIASHSDTPA